MKDCFERNWHFFLSFFLYFFFDVLSCYNFGDTSATLRCECYKVQQLEVEGMVEELVE